MTSNFWSSSHCNHWLLDPQSILSTRRLDYRYCTPRQYASIHIFFSNIIQKLGKRLSLRQIPLATANIFFKRFYLKSALCETDPFLVVSACVYVAAKVEETPVHIKSVVSESRHCYNEYQIKTFPTDYTKLAEMEFYLLSDLDFHLVVYHPYRTLSAVCGRDPIDPGTFEDEESDEGGAKMVLDVEEEMGAFGEKAVVEMEEAERIRKEFGRGSGKDVGYVEDSILQMAWFIVNDTYRTDIPLQYPPYIVALAALYVSFIITEKSPAAMAAAAQVQAAKMLDSSTIAAAINTPSARTLRPAGTPGSISPSTQLPAISANQIIAMEQGRKIIGRAQAAELFAGLNVNMGTLLRVVQELIAIYPVWDELDAGMTAGSAAAIVMASVGLSNMGRTSAGTDSRLNSGRSSPVATKPVTPADSKVYKPDVGLAESEVVGFLNKMRATRLTDIGHPEDAGSGNALAAESGRPAKRAKERG